MRYELSEAEWTAIKRRRDPARSDILIPSPQPPTNTGKPVSDPEPDSDSPSCDFR
jgi:hypothetical protein